MSDPGRRRFALVAGVLVVLVLVVAFVHFRRTALPVTMVGVHEAPFTIALPESGVIQYPQIETIASQVSANVGHVYVKAGERVIAGQLLATLVNPQVTSQAQSSGAAYRAASARAQSAQVTDTTNVVQAEENLETARAHLAQARQDLASGLQSGEGFGESTAADQRAQANANYVTAATGLREAQRLYYAYKDLYANKAISRDQLDQAEAKYEQAQAAYHQASLARSSLGVQLSRSQTVLQDNLRSATEGYAQAQAALTAARVESAGGDVAAASAEASRAGAEYDLAAQLADAMRVRAPYDATVLGVSTEKADSLRPLQPGDAVTAGQPLLTLAARRAFVVRTRVDEQDVINVRLGETVQITGEDFPGRVLRGRVIEISPIAQRSDDSAPASSTSRTIATTIGVESPPAFLRDGMSVDVDILTTDLPHAIVVPNEAIVHDGNQTYVYVVRGGTAYRRPVRVDLSNETSSAIASGLSPGDVIVSSNVTGLTDGAAVTTASAPGAVHS
ncbi:MAG TPA: efflux RND transporter periplasmic adaptor subunit [Candidatus Cybelea sp.]|jgi:RND family efflux transporter MFP subunit|nr:efflux RND transporter periplasmic adaptor subunit [Candidatus Cybelea sp.]